MYPEPVKESYAHSLGFSDGSRSLERLHSHHRRHRRARLSGDGGPATKAQVKGPFGVLKGPDGGLYICDTYNHVIRRMDPNGNITTVAGTGQKGYSGDGGPATQARLNEPYEIRIDAAGNLVFVEMQNHLVRQVDAETGRIRTLAGTGERGFSGDGGPATKATMNRPHSIQFGPAGHLYVCDIGNHRIRRVDAKTGRITTFAGTGERNPRRMGPRFRRCAERPAGD